jgi:hypothetical protein
MYLFYCIKCTIPYQSLTLIMTVSGVSAHQTKPPGLSGHASKPVFERCLVWKLGHLRGTVLTEVLQGIPQSLQADHNSHYSVITLPIQSRDRAVSIATGYGLDDRGVGVQVPVGSRIFFSPHHLDQLWGPPSLLSNGYQGLFLLR